MLKHDEVRDAERPTQKISVSFKLIELRPKQVADLLKSLIGIGGMCEQTRDVCIESPGRSAEQNQELAMQFRIVRRRHFAFVKLRINHNGIGSCSKIGSAF